MAWVLKWGSQVKTLLEVQEATGITPKALLDKPTLSERWHFTKEVFEELDGSRQHTMNGPAGIPISEFMTYANLYGFSRAECIEVWEDVQTYDSLWLSEVSKRREATKSS